MENFNDDGILFKPKVVALRFSSEKTPGMIADIYLRDVREAVLIAGTNREVNRRIMLELKELLAIAETNEVKLNSIGA